MNERCVRVVISGQGEQQVQLSLRSNGAQGPLVVHVASLCPSAPGRVHEATGTSEVKLPAAPAALSLELRWSDPEPVQPQPRCEPAPLAAAWALSQWLREREAAAPMPRPRSVRVPVG
jgi:hypothetical protein